MNKIQSVSLTAFAAGVLSVALLTGRSYLCAADTAANGELPEIRLHLDDSSLQRQHPDRITSYADVLERATPAVVSVSTRLLLQQSRQRPQNLEDMLRHFYGLPPQGQSDETNRGVPETERLVPYGVGSGFIVSDNGYVLTNHHVVTDRQGEAADEIVIGLEDGREFTAHFVGSDPQTDLAVLKIEGENLPAVTFGPVNELRVGDIVFAIGNPLNVGTTVTQGIVSARDRTNLGLLRRSGGFESFIQTDAAINLGNSGGPLVDAEGRVVGINTAILSRSGGNIGIGFAIPADLAQTVLYDLVRGGEVRRGFIGVIPADMDREMSSAFGLSTSMGALIQQVTPGLPADKAGLRHGDVIIDVDGQKVHSASALRYLISRSPPGTVVDLTVVRAGKTHQFKVELADRSILRENGEPTRSSKPETREVLPGVRFQPLDDEIRNTFDVPEGIEGLVVQTVSDQSPYKGLLIPGMVIIEVNGEAVADTGQLADVLRKDRPNAFYLYYQGTYSFLPIAVRDSTP